jgi:hypothetical protein
MAESIAKELESRKIDVASFYNVDPSKIAEDLQSAFAGQTDVLRKYFVYVNADQIKASGLTAAEAISRAFLRGTEVSKGDFERTKNSIANLQRATMVVSSMAYAKVGESFYGLGQALEVAKQSFWRLIGTMADMGVFTTFGNALTESVYAAGMFVGALSEIGITTGTVSGLITGFGEAIKSVLITGILLVKRPLDMLALGFMTTYLHMIRLSQYLASWVGQDIAGEQRADIEKAISDLSRNLAGPRAEIESRIDQRVADLKKNVESPINPLGAPVAPRVMGGGGGSSAYTAALSGAFSRENLQLNEAQKQTKLLEKIAGNKPGQRGGVVDVVSKPSPMAVLDVGMRA